MDGIPSDFHQIAMEHRVNYSKNLLSGVVMLVEILNIPLAAEVWVTALSHQSASIHMHQMVYTCNRESQ